MTNSNSSHESSPFKMYVGVEYLMSEYGWTREEAEAALQDPDFRLMVKATLSSATTTTKIAYLQERTKQIVEEAKKSSDAS